MQFTVIANSTSVHQIQHQQLLLEGLKALGIDAKASSAARANTKYVACWGWRIGNTLREQGHEVLVMERGYLGDRFAWTSLAWNGLNGYGEFGKAPEDNGQRFKSNFNMKEWKKENGANVLIMGQVPGDASLRGRNMMPWYEAVAVLAADAYGLPVKFRAHPVAEKRGLAQSPRHCQKSFGSLDEALQDAHVVITYNSNSAVDAVLAGVPTIAMDKGSMAWGVTGHNIGDRSCPDREQWSSALAWTQWSNEEIQNGTALKKLLEVKNS